MQLSIVLPAFNESGCIADSLKQVLDFCHRELSQWEVIVVDDGSTDGTKAIAQSFKEVRTFQNEVNRGKGYSGGGETCPGCHVLYRKSGTQ